MSLGKLFGDLLNKIIIFKPEIPEDKVSLEQEKGLVRDFVSMKTSRLLADGRRPLWKGPIPDRYYYAVKNKKHPTMGAWIVRYTDDPRFEPYVRQIVCKQGGDWSLIESDVPLPEDLNCVKRAHSKVEEIKEILYRSHPRKSILTDTNGNRFDVPATPPKEEEVFG